jgi:hypothetical protein
MSYIQILLNKSFASFPFQGYSEFGRGEIKTKPNPDATMCYNYTYNH